MKLNRIICVAACLLGACSFIATNRASALAVVLVSVAMPAISAIVGRVSTRRIELAFDMQRSCTVGQPLTLSIAVSRGFAWRGSIELLFECKNLMTGSLERVTVSLLPASVKTERFDLPMDTACCGTVAVSLIQAGCYDPLGFGETRIENASFSSSYTVYPKLLDIQVGTDFTSRSNAFGTDYDRRRKGQDQTEVFDLRAFRDGDSIKQVHWKLSASFDDLLVRESSRPADFDVALVAGVVAGDPEDPDRVEKLNATLALFASISWALLRQGIAHDAIRNEEGLFTVVSVDTREAFEDMLDELMVTPLPQRSRPASEPGFIEEITQRRAIAKILFVCNFISDELFARVADITDLSVIHVGNAASTESSANGRYLVSHIDAESVGEGMKSLEL